MFNGIVESTPNKRAPRNVTNRSSNSCPPPLVHTLLPSIETVPPARHELEETATCPTSSPRSRPLIGLTDSSSGTPVKGADQPENSDHEDSDSLPLSLGNDGAEENMPTSPEDSAVDPVAQQNVEHDTDTLAAYVVQLCRLQGQPASAETGQSLKTH